MGGYDRGDNPFAGYPLDKMAPPGYYGPTDPEQPKKTTYIEELSKQVNSLSREERTNILRKVEAEMGTFGVGENPYESQSERYPMTKEEAYKAVSGVRPSERNNIWAFLDELETCIEQLNGTIEQLESKLRPVMLYRDSDVKDPGGSTIAEKGSPVAENLRNAINAVRNIRHNVVALTDQIDLP